MEESNKQSPSASLHGCDLNTEMSHENIKVEPKSEFDIIEIDDRIFSQNVTNDSNEDSWRVNQSARFNDEDDQMYDEIIFSHEIVKEEPKFQESIESETETIMSLPIAKSLESLKMEKVNDNQELQTNRDNSKRLRCSFCHRIFASQQRLSKHERIHTNDKPYQCSICQKRFNQKYSMQLHQKIHTGEKPFECSQCSMQFRLKLFLDRHMKNHASNNEEVCNSQKNVHQLIPEQLIGLRTYECYICSTPFQFNRSNMKIHMNIQHTGGTLYNCKLCAKQFLQKYSLQKHSRNTHSGMRPFECKICDKRFAISHDLNRHLQCHKSDELPFFQCEFCPKKLSTKKILKTHLKTHTALKPYECEFCGKTFLKNGCLTRHKRTHTGDRPFECNICGRLFSRNHLLTDHKRNIHKC